MGIRAKGGRLFLGILFLSLSLGLADLPAQAEMYVAGQVGLTVPQDLGRVDWSVGPMSVRGNDLALSNSVMYGAKLGYYFDSLKWGAVHLGLETEVFNATPHIKQQDYTIGGNPLGTSPGANFRVLTWAPFNVVARYQLGPLEPYAGIGLGVFFSRIADSDTSSNSTDVGLNTQVGLRYRITEHVAAFGEWKYNHARLSHTDLAGLGLDVSANYNAHHFVLGLGYHF